MRILITDDSEAIRKVLADLLTKQGFQVDMAESCSATIRRLARQTYDCLILDNDLPDGRGMDIFKVLNSPASHVFLFTTEALSSSGQQAAASLGVEKVFMKPSQTRELVAYVIDACSLPQGSDLARDGSTG